MDRFAVFVDAGYLYAAGGKVTCGRKTRAAFDFDPVGFMGTLLPRLKEMSGLPLLRTYWYDGAKRGIPTVQQQNVASLPSVKLRLGRLNSKNQQKGVDALIYHDLITLASTRSIADAFLLSGDEDLREGVRAAQGAGVRVGLVGIDEGDTRNQSPELCDEVDEHLTLFVEDLSPFFRPLPTATPPDQARGNGTSSPVSGLDPADVERLGREFGEEWFRSASADERDALRQGRPKIPRPIDVDLVRHAESQFGMTFRGQETARRGLRHGFWVAIDQGAIRSDPGGLSPTT